MFPDKSREVKATSPKPKNACQTTMPFQKKHFFWNDTASICFGVFVGTSLQPSPIHKELSLAEVKNYLRNPNFAMSEE